MTLAAVEVGEAGFARAAMAHAGPLLEKIGERSCEQFAELSARVGE
ncbi:hypothetical protein AB0C93_03895 [Streptomyces sp. NPDC048518]